MNTDKPYAYNVDNVQSMGTKLPEIIASVLNVGELHTGWMYKLLCRAFTRIFRDIRRRLVAACEETLIFKHTRYINDKNSDAFRRIDRWSIAIFGFSYSPPINLPNLISLVTRDFVLSIFSRQDCVSP